jgi:hypothetical protein
MYDPFTRLDDALIDGVFQPVTDRIHERTSLDGAGLAA